MGVMGGRRRGRGRQPSFALTLTNPLYLPYAGPHCNPRAVSSATGIITTVSGVPYGAGFAGNGVSTVAVT